MRNEKKIDINDREIIVRELSVRQIDAMMGNIDGTKKINACELLMNDGVPAECVTLATGLSLEELEGDLTPSELRLIWDAVVETNPFLFRLIQRATAPVNGSGATENPFVPPSVS